MDGDATVTNDTIGQHLMFYRALIDDDVGTEKIDRYMRILKEETGAGETMEDPTDESISSVFRLVLEQNLDPWAIDLHEFVRLYSEKAKTSVVDMIVAGKLVLMAWKVLRMQSDATREESDRNAQDECDFGFEFDSNLFDETEELYVPAVSLKETYRRTPVRPVTMLELLDAFDEAREEIDASNERERVRLELKAKEPKKFENKAHKEDDKRDVEAVWEKIQKLGTGALSITDLYTNDIDENITVFVSVLHLVRDGKLAIWQDSMPYGDITVEIKVDWMSGTVEDAGPDQRVPEAVV